MWMHRFDKLYQQPKPEIDAELLSLYESALSELSDEQLEEACRMTVKTCERFFPKPAVILAHVSTADSESLDADAEDAWRYIRRYVAKFVLPGIGMASDAPPLEAVIEKAAYAAGGLVWLESCPTKELVWARKTFIENYKRLHRLPEHSLLISNGEAKKFFADLATPKQLPAVVRAVSAPAVVAPRTVPKKPETPPVELSEEEWQRRKDEQKRRLEEYLAEQSRSKNPVPPVPVTASADGAALR